MPIEVNRKNIECPKCKSQTIFDVDGQGYFCGTCLTDFDKDMQPKQETKDEFEEHFGKRIQTNEQYLLEKKRLQELQSTDYALNPSTEVDLRLDINELQMRTKEYEERMKNKSDLVPDTMIENVIQDEQVELIKEAIEKSEQVNLE